MIKRICDICCEEIVDNYKIVTYEWDKPEFRMSENHMEFDRNPESKDICPICWATILDFATRFKKDPHIHIITDEEFHSL